MHCSMYIVHYHNPNILDKVARKKITVLKTVNSEEKFGFLNYTYTWKFY